MALTSAVPGALDALVAMLLDDVPLAGVDVVDGPLADWAVMRPVGRGQRGDGRRWLVIGAQPDDGNRSAEGEQEWGGTGTGQNHHSRDERFAIYCTAVSFGGGQSVQPVRAAAFGMVSRVELLLRADPSIGGSVLYSAFGGVTELRQAAHEKGLTVDVLFNIQCRAYLTS